MDSPGPYMLPAGVPVSELEKTDEDDVIGLWGVDMSATEEYARQRPASIGDRPEDVAQAFDRSDLGAASQATLDVAVDQLNRCPNLRARVEGHTDWIGSNEYNDGMSLRRSKSVVDYLVGRGVSPARLESAGFGETQPFATNDTSEGRALNRRVELKPLN